MSDKKKIERINVLELDIKKSKKNANHLVELLEFCEDEDSEIAFKSIGALQRIFGIYISNGLLLGKTKKSRHKRTKIENAEVETETDPKEAFVLWLHKLYLEFIRNALSAMSRASEPHLQIAILKIVLQFVDIESRKLMESESHLFPNTLFRRMIYALMACEHFNEALVNEFVANYLLEYDDIRYYTYKNLSAFLNEESAEMEKKLSLTPMQMSARMFKIIGRVTNLPNVPEDLNAYYSPIETEFTEESTEIGCRKRRLDDKNTALVNLLGHRRVFSEFWIAFLRRPLDSDTYKRVLLMIHDSVIPHLIKPRLLIDFLTDSYNQGGVISVLSLSGVFTLITKYDLDYPEFYKKLYRLLDHQIFFVKYRDRFLQLVDKCLDSPLIPAYLVAAFIKRTCRIGLRVPPSGLAFILPFIHNLLRRHPNTMPMIHRVNCKGEDCFVPEEEDPALCKAIDSSLWELDILTEHYVPSLSKFSNVYKDVFSKKDYNIQDFLGQDYMTLFDEEINRKVQSVPLEYKVPSGIFGDAMGMWTLD